MALWESGTATGLGPFPGVDPLAAARLVLTELAPRGIPFLAELPERGIGSDAVGRTAGMLADLHVEVGVGAWRFVPRGGKDEQRAHVALVTDLDALEEVAHGYDGSLKVRIVGPWSLACSVELAKGEKALADEGAVRDITASLAEGLTRHLDDLHKRLPALGRIIVQIDEPLLAAVLEGELATASGWGRIRSYERSVVEDALRQVVDAAGRSGRRPAPEREPGAPPDGAEPQGSGDAAGVWIGGSRLDGELLRGSGAAFIGIDGAAVDTVDEDEIGEAVDAGVGLLVACVPLEAPRKDPRPVMAPVRSLWKRLGFLGELLPETVAVAPAEGLETISIGDVPALLQRAVAAGRYLEESAVEEET